jgi:hypothetical protein
VATAVAGLLLAGCAGGAGSQAGAAGPATGGSGGATGSATSSAHLHHTATSPPEAPLRRGERFITLRMPAAYTPKAPTAPGTDDYRCFLLDPHLTRSSVVTGINVLPGNPDVVHHVILFSVPPSQVGAAEARDAAQAGEGWTCFGGSGVQSQGATLDSAPWLGAWAPGGGERVLAPDLGMPLAAGSRIIMQVHYNLLAGQAPDTSAAKLRVAADDGTRKALETVLLPAPVELPCRPGHTGPLCDRASAAADVRLRFGDRAGRTGDLLNLLCPGNAPGPTQSCTRPVTEAGTIRAVAGHMHLLGRSISVTVDQGTPRARTVLDIPVWDFDNQGSRAVRPVHIKPGDTLTVSCTHDQSLRDVLPAFQGQPERYVMWGEGTTDEMCLGLVLVTHP